MQTLNDLIVRFDIDPSHTLKQQNHQSVEKQNTFFETCWYVEKNEAEEIVARYRSWSNQGMQAPFRTQLGWERYTPDGELLEREVKYAKAELENPVH